jgi:hypothetical protein
MSESLRKKIADFVRANTRNINTFFGDKVEEFILLDEQPAAVKVGNPVGNYKTLYIGNFTIMESNKFWVSYGHILAHMGVKFVNFDLLNDAKEIYSRMHTNKRFYKELCRLIHKHICKQQAYFLPGDKDTRKRQLKQWKNCSLRWFIRNVQEVQLIQICGLIYLFNFDSVKKNFSTLLSLMDGAPPSETYIYNWLENAGGLTGNFLQRHLQKPLWWLRELGNQKEDNSQSPQQNEQNNEAKTAN